MSDLKFWLSQPHYWQVLGLLFFFFLSVSFHFWVFASLWQCCPKYQSVAKYRCWKSETVSLQLWVDTHTRRCSVHTGPPPHTPLTCYIYLLIKKGKCEKCMPSMLRQYFTAASTIDIFQSIVLRFNFNSFFYVLTPSTCFFFIFF